MSAQIPEEWSGNFAKHLNAGDLEAVMALYAGVDPRRCVACWRARHELDAHQSPRARVPRARLSRPS